MDNLAGYFSKNYGPLKGSDWIRRIPVEDRKAFCYIGRAAGNHGRNGGLARAATAKRDEKGRFV